MQFEGGRSAEEIRKFWQNCEHPSINKQEWSGQEVDQLKAIAAKHGHLQWQKIAKELGVRTGEALGARLEGWAGLRSPWATCPSPTLGASRFLPPATLEGVAHGKNSLSSPLWAVFGGFWLLSPCLSLSAHPPSSSLLRPVFGFLLDPSLFPSSSGVGSDGF